MARMSFEARIADLERIDRPPEAVVEAAANILGFSLEGNKERDLVEPRHSTSPHSGGFKEQWVLRWFLKKLGGSSSKDGKEKTGNSRQSFILCPQFWLLLFNLTCSIPDDVSLEILLERKFFEALNEAIQIVLHGRDQGIVSSTQYGAEAENEGPPMKKRRLSPPVSSAQNDTPRQETLSWILLQSACRCVGLLGGSASRSRKSHYMPLSWTATWKDQASLLGSFLRLATSVLENISTEKQRVSFAEILITLLSCWNGDSSASRTEGDELHQAFTSHCLEHALVLLDYLRGPRFSHKSFTPSRNALQRLIAMHVVFPARATFNERFAKKWKGAYDVLLYEHLENQLKNFSDRIEPHKSPGRLDLSWMIFDIAARTIPSSDIRKRRLEQPWIDALFISVAHVLWPRIPRISSTGVVQQQVSLASSLKDQEYWVPPLVDLVDVASSQKVHISLPVLGYLLSAILALEEQSTPWTLLAKISRLDINILVPNSGLSTSDDLLKQLLSKIESCNVSPNVYALLRDDIILPLLGGFARSRDLQGFTRIWQQGLEDAIRVRYTSKHDPDNIPAVLVWEDEDVFDEFKTLSLLHAPPSMGQQMLKDLVESLKKISDKVGSTADVFAKIAIFCSFLENSSQVLHSNFSSNHLVSLFRGVMNALPRKSDYQAQRWRLWKVVRIIVRLLDLASLPHDLDQLLGPDYNFMSLQAVGAFDDTDPSRKAASKYLECLQCFAVVVELAAKSQHFRPNLEAEMKFLDDPVAVDVRYDALLWRGRIFECNNRTNLLAACVGVVLQRSEIFLVYPEVFKDFIQMCLKDVARSQHSDYAGIISPNLQDLWTAVLKVEDIVQSPLRRLIFDHVANTVESCDPNREVHRSLSQGLPVETMSKSLTKTFATSIFTHLFRHSRVSTLEAIAGALSLLIYIDCLTPLAVLNPKDWREWVSFSEIFARRRDQELSVSYLLVRNMLNNILEQIWARALAAPKTPFSENILSLLAKTIEDRGIYREDPRLFWLQSLLRCARQSNSQFNSTFWQGKLQQIQGLLLNTFTSREDQEAGRNNECKNLLELKLIVDAAHTLDNALSDAEVQQVVSNILTELKEINLSDHKAVSSSQWHRLCLSIQRECLQMSSPTEPKLDKEEIEQGIRRLASSLEDDNQWTNDKLFLLAANADLFVRQIGPPCWHLALASLRSASTLGEELTCPVVTASILPLIDKQHILQYPPLGQELAEIASMSSRSEEWSRTRLFLGLENCKTVLEFHPLVVNQSTLDRLLASIHAITSRGSDDLRSLEDTERKSGPKPEDVYAQLCQVIGIVLSRHRRRVSDRYHLLLPAMQCLLRCLFWPGQESLLNERRAGIASTASTFSKTLPRWMRGSSEALPPCSAEKFARLLSSICNPTVSAARSSKKRAHNELNDEIKTARKMAGQHMQYLVMEYTRCTLDGQIAPSAKEQLVPGMYRVMDAMDRDLMRALNAGMDPSSRAIFKNLYNDWTRYGKWDKS